ncbi:hypothetical protein ACFQGT_12810 [Natrialbaceae archaeon GCM10025810]|uniref:hypothetical protein n=1 Tax=Halovalidus salilacus TaxID=3075124 RepID=UPI0036139C9C
MSLASLAALFRDHPVAAALELGSVVTCALLFVGTIAALATGLPAGAGAVDGEPELGGLWFAIVVVGATFVVFWTVLVPLYERLFLGLD